MPVCSLQELYMVKTAVASFIFYTFTVTLPHVSYGFISNDGTSKFQLIVSLAWVGIALQPVVFFATNRKYRKHMVAHMCHREFSREDETSCSTRRRSTGGSSIVSRVNSRISFSEVRMIVDVFPPAGLINIPNLLNMSSKNGRYTIEYA